MCILQTAKLNNKLEENINKNRKDMKRLNIQKGFFCNSVTKAF